jgi:hypothetical protein
MKALICDNCDLIASTPEPPGWLHVEPLGPDITTFGHEPMIADFCSVACAVVYLPDTAYNSEKQEK